MIKIIISFICGSISMFALLVIIGGIKKYKESIEWTQEDYENEKVDLEHRLSMKLKAEEEIRKLKEMNLDEFLRGLK
jgi:hypothetical protein